MRHEKQNEVLKIVVGLLIIAAVILVYYRKESLVLARAVQKAIQVPKLLNRVIQSRCHLLNM